MESNFVSLPSLRNMLRQPARIFPRGSYLPGWKTWKKYSSNPGRLFHLVDAYFLQIFYSRNVFANFNGTINENGVTKKITLELRCTEYTLENGLYQTHLNNARNMLWRQRAEGKQWYNFACDHDNEMQWRARCSKRQFHKWFTNILVYRVKNTIRCPVVVWFSIYFFRQCFFSAAHHWWTECVCDCEWRIGFY